MARMLRLLVASLSWAAARADTCTALRGGPFTYEQESAPRDISAALRLVTGLINKELTAVVNVELPYVGDLIHAIVGEHTVRATVTQRVRAGAAPGGGEGGGANASEVTQCFETKLVITDTNECALAPGSVWRHRCDASARCENTVGGYECACADGFFADGRAGAPAGACAGAASSAACCNSSAGGGALGGGAPGGGRKGHDARIAEHWYFWALNRAVFVHPPKTGGTSLEALLYSAPMLG